MIKFRHYTMDSSEVASKGGATLAFADDVGPNGKAFYAGAMAFCCPKDNFCRERGRFKATCQLNKYASSGYKINEEVAATGAPRHHFVNTSSMKEFLQAVDDDMFAIGYVPR
jgi:hypothetical protein